jgi:IclR family transcriptional regulator, acetate operon repressor
MRLSDCEALERSTSNAANRHTVERGEGADTESKTSSVRSVRRLLDIIEFFATTRKPATLSMIAHAIGLPKSSCSALLATLVESGYLYEIAPRAGFYPTRRWLEAFSTISSADPLAAWIRPILQTLGNATGETVVLAKRSGAAVSYLEVIESDEAIRYAARVGQRRPLYATASGKAILATMSHDERRRLIGTGPFTGLAPGIESDLVKLERDLESSRARGWYATTGETQVGVSGIAVTIAIGGEPYAIVIAGPSYRIDDRFQEFAALLFAARASIGNR